MIAKPATQVVRALLQADPIWRSFLPAPAPAPRLTNPTPEQRILVYLVEQARRGWERGRDPNGAPAVFATADGVDDWPHRAAWWKEHGDLDAIDNLSRRGLVAPGWGHKREDPWHLTPAGDRSLRTRWPQAAVDYIVQENLEGRTVTATEVAQAVCVNRSTLYKDSDDPVRVRLRRLLDAQGAIHRQPGGSLKEGEIEGEQRFSPA